LHTQLNTKQELTPQISSSFFPLLSHRIQNPNTPALATTTSSTNNDTGFKQVNEEVIGKSPGISSATGSGVSSATVLT